MQRNTNNRKKQKNHRRLLASSRRLLASRRRLLVSRRRLRVFSAIAGILLLLVVLSGTTMAARQSGIQHEIADEIIRFHVLANSDSAADQKEKMQVKEAVVDALRPLLAGKETKEETKQILLENREQILEIAETAANGHEVSMELKTEWFPQKEYGEYVFPEGMYEACCIRIGEAEGHNWWCVLYPGLCFSDAVRPVVTEENEELLDRLLTEEAYDFIRYPAKTKIRLWLEFLYEKM